MSYARRAPHDPAAVSERRARLLAHLRASSAPQSAREIAAAIGIGHVAVNNDLNALLARGEVEKPELGRWCLPRSAKVRP